MDVRERVAHAENLIDSSVGRLQCRRGEEIGRSIPGDVRDGLELIGDFGDGDTDDGLVEGDEEDGQIQGEDDDYDLAQRRVFGVFGGSLDIDIFLFLQGGFYVGAAGAGVCHGEGDGQYSSRIVDMVR